MSQARTTSQANANRLLAALPAEVDLVGNGGMVGIALFMGGDTSLNQAIMQGASEALRMSAKAMQEEFKRGE